MSLQTYSKQQKSQISLVQIISISAYPLSLINVYWQTAWSCCICYCLATPDRWSQERPSLCVNIRSFDWSTKSSLSLWLAVPDPSIPFLAGLSQSISWPEGPNHSHFLIHLPSQPFCYPFVTTLNTLWTISPFLSPAPWLSQHFLVTILVMSLPFPCPHSSIHCHWHQFRSHTHDVDIW